MLELDGFLLQQNLEIQAKHSFPGRDFRVSFQFLFHFGIMGDHRGLDNAQDIYVWHYFFFAISILKHISEIRQVDF